ncbi:MAG: hypothetical protein K6F61_10870 [Clostridiales bacterium]|nr:hypothetical protein [Clostridiales bacterium]
MKRLAGLLLVLALVFALSAALADRQPCETGGFSVKLPDHFVEEPGNYSSDLCFYWHGNKLTVQAYAIYQGEVTETFEVLTGNETDSGYVTINGMRMFYTRSEDASGICITYTWMDRGNSVTMEFSYSADDPSVENTVKSIINSIRFDAGH